MQLSIIGQVKDFEIYSDVNKFVTNENESIKIIRPTHSIFYINCDFFRQEINRICPLKNVHANATICENVGLYKITLKI